MEDEDHQFYFLNNFLNMCISRKKLRNHLSQRTISLRVILTLMLQNLIYKKGMYEVALIYLEASFFVQKFYILIEVSLKLMVFNF